MLPGCAINHSLPIPLMTEHAFISSGLLSVVIKKLAERDCSQVLEIRLYQIRVGGGPKVESNKYNSHRMKYTWP